MIITAIEVYTKNSVIFTSKVLRDGVTIGKKHI